MDTSKGEIYRVRLFTAAEEETSADNFLFNDSFDTSKSLDSALFAGCEVNNVMCTPIRFNTNLRTMEQTPVEAGVEELLNEARAVNSEVSNSESLVQSLESTSQSTTVTINDYFKCRSDISANRV